MCWARWVHVHLEHSEQDKDAALRDINLQPRNALTSYFRDGGSWAKQISMATVNLEVGLVSRNDFDG